MAAMTAVKRICAPTNAASANSSAHSTRPRGVRLSRSLIKQ